MSLKGFRNMKEMFCGRRFHFMSISRNCFQRSVRQ